ncbi:hypothetical protein Btru_053826 [Bulinus truncatus]|nr:hypothetical protein Btru_053826 [Bulinus truncatus]
MLLYRKSDIESLSQSEKQLKQAIRIQKVAKWNHYYNALTLTHLAQVKLKRQEYFKSFKYNLKALSILKDKTQEKDLLMKVLLELAHCRIVLGLNKWSQVSEHDFSQMYLQKSAEEYIQDILEIGKLRGIDSLDFHHNFLSTCEHGMLFHIGHSLLNYDKYKRAYLEHLNEYVKIESILKGETITKSHLILRHRKFYIYVMETDYNTTEYEKLYSCLLKSCESCLMLREDIVEYTLLQELSDQESPDLKSGQCPKV